MVQLSTVLLLPTINSNSRDGWKVTGSSLQGQEKFSCKAKVIGYLLFASVLIIRGIYLEILLNYLLELYLKGFLFVCFWWLWLWLSVPSLGQSIQLLGMHKVPPQGMTLPPDDSQSFVASVGAPVHALLYTPGPWYNSWYFYLCWHWLSYILGWEKHQCYLWYFPPFFFWSKLFEISLLWHCISTLQFDSYQSGLGSVARTRNHSVLSRKEFDRGN